MKPHPAFAAIEFNSVPVGLFAADALLKKSPISLIRSGTIGAGRFLILLAGTTASVAEAHAEALFHGGLQVADDTFLPAYQQQTIVGKGPMLRFIDSKMITNPRFQKFALDIAKKFDIPVQKGVRSGGATNASALHLSEQGIPTIVIGIPVRYAHTHWGVSSLDDVQNSVRLAEAVLRELNAQTIATF